MVNYGKYIANAASCIECHTPFEKEKLVEGKIMPGGREFISNGSVIRSSNITTDLETELVHGPKNNLYLFSEFVRLCYIS